MSELIGLETLFGELSLEDPSKEGVLSGGNTLTGSICFTNSLRLNGTLTIPLLPEINYYDGPYDVTPKTSEQILNTTSSYLTDDVTVRKIPYFETSNNTGTTVYIAGEV